MPSTSIHTHSSWALSFSSIVRTSLPFTPPTTVCSKIVVILHEQVVAQGVKVWENSLVWQIIDAKVPYVIVQRLIEKLWGKFEMSTITILENDLISFQFK